MDRRGFTLEVDGFPLEVDGFPFEVDGFPFRSLNALSFEGVIIVRIGSISDSSPSDSDDNDNTLLPCKSALEKLLLLVRFDPLVL